jgi:hypothetical protein
MGSNRLICIVRKTQHQNPKFGHTQGEIKKKPTKKYISIQSKGETKKTINFCGKLSFILSFIFLECLHYYYICFHAPTCITTIIIFEPCALNVEFQDFILRFNEISLLCGYH